MSKEARTTRRHEIRSAIQQMILQGELASGQKLVQRDLAARFGVAQGLLRETLLELVGCGLVEMVDNQGVFVRQLDSAAMIEALQVREMHETLAVRLCCRRTTREDLDQLRDLAERMYTLGQEGKEIESSEMGWLDREFHCRLLELSGNDLLVRLADAYLILGKVVRMGRDAKEVYEDHLALLDAIEAGYADEAERLVRDHIRSAETALSDRMAQGDNMPVWLGKGPNKQITQDRDS
ncbi:MAG: GntR family transcriptional regulator [Sedimentisphaerales bacterium]|nr:GntR family transcriptional regulator [Sedimentisphaerales bacterium]